MSTAGRRFAQLVALPVAEQSALLLSLLLVAHVRLALYVLPSRVSVRLVRRLAETDTVDAPDGRVSAAHVAWAVNAASRVVPNATCLTQAVAGQLLFRRYGYASKLCLGVARPTKGEFYAHAWIERDGRILVGGAQSTEFTRLPSLASTSRRKQQMKTR